MTNKEIILIDAIENFEISPENIPIEIIKAFDNLREKILSINKLEKPNFTENDYLINMKYWNDYKFIGMNAWEFIKTKFYKYGFVNKSNSED